MSGEIVAAVPVNDVPYRAPRFSSVAGRGHTLGKKSGNKRSECGCLHQRAPKLTRFSAAQTIGGLSTDL
jgi:hypothetical protein